MNKTERLQIRITPELKRQLQERAREDGRTLSNYVEQLVLAAVKVNKKEEYNHD
jgi:predicted HicB family RNase H-like nuclease